MPLRSQPDHTVGRCRTWRGTALECGFLQHSAALGGRRREGRGGEGRVGEGRIGEGGNEEKGGNEKRGG